VKEQENFQSFFPMFRASAMFCLFPRCCGIESILVADSAISDRASGMLQV
jgi:hypothetical protein